MKLDESAADACGRDGEGLGLQFQHEPGELEDEAVARVHHVRCTVVSVESPGVVSNENFGFAQPLDVGDRKLLVSASLDADGEFMQSASGVQGWLQPGHLKSRWSSQMCFRARTRVGAAASRVEAALEPLLRWGTGKPPGCRALGL